MYRDWIYKALVTMFTIVSIALVILVLFPAIVLAQVTSLPDAIPDMGGFWAAIGASHWPLAVGIGLTLLVWAMRSFVMHKIPKNVLPWMTLALAVIGTAGTRMAQAIGDNLPWWQGMVQGILEGTSIGFAAIGWWDIKQSVKKTQRE